MFAIAVSISFDSPCSDPSKPDIPGIIDYSPVYLEKRPIGDWVITLIARGILYDNGDTNIPHVIHISSDDHTWVEFARFDHNGDPTDMSFANANPQHSFTTSKQSDETLSDLEKLRYTQGFDDAVNRRPACLSDAEYIRGYNEGRRKRSITW